MARSFRGWRWLGAGTLVAIGPVGGTSVAGAQGADTAQGAAAVPTLPSVSGSLPTLSGGGWAHPHAASSAQLHTEPPQFVTPPRKHVGGVENATESLNWSGQYLNGSTFTGIEGNWTVPTVQATQATEASGTWIGIDDGTPSSDGDIIQTGTGQLAQGGGTGYYAWYELYPAPPVILGQVAPGDQMEAEIVQTSGSAWTIDIVDVTENVGRPIDVTYDGPATTGEWIEELPAASSGPQPYLANFGSVTFTGLGFGAADPNAVGVTPLDIVDPDGNVISSTGSITPAPAFTITYVPEPTTTAISAGAGAIGRRAGGDLLRRGQFAGSCRRRAPWHSPTVEPRLCAAAISNGAGSCTAKNTPVGNGVVQGQYSGDANSGTSSGSTNVVVTPHGYWLVGSDGGIFTFGSAQFYGSTGSLNLQRPVVGITPTSSDTGYWLVASDGGIFSFNTGFYGSIPGLGLHPAGSGQPNSLNAPIVGMVPDRLRRRLLHGGLRRRGLLVRGRQVRGVVPRHRRLRRSRRWRWRPTPAATGTGSSPRPGTLHVRRRRLLRHAGAAELGHHLHGAHARRSGVLDPRRQRPGLPATANAAGLGSVAPNTTGGLNPATAIAATSDGGGYWVASACGSRLQLRRRPQ